MAARDTPVTFRQSSKLAAAKFGELKDKEAPSDLGVTASDKTPEKKEDKTDNKSANASADNDVHGGSARFVSTRIRRDWAPDGGPMDSIKEMHKSIQDSIMMMQKKTVRMLENQERDLIRDFKTKLIAVEQELFKEKKKNENGSVEWVEKCHKLTSELEWLRDTAKKLSEENKNVNKEMRRLRKTLKQKEEDREYLIKQLVDVKKENQQIVSVRPSSNPVPPVIARLERPYTATLDSSALAKGATSPLQRSNSDLEDAFMVGSRRMSPKGATFTAQQERRYKNVIARLKRQLEVEQAKAKKLRAQYRAEMSTRNELQNILKMCVMDVRQAVIHEGSSEGSTETKMQNLSPEERFQVIERLMTNDKVVYLLYERMFPGRKADNVAVDQLLQQMDKESRNQNPEDMQPYSGWVESKLSRPTRGGGSVGSSLSGSRPVSRTGTAGTKKSSRKSSARYPVSSAGRR